MRKYLILIVAVLLSATAVMAQPPRTGARTTSSSSSKDSGNGLFKRRQPASYYVDQVTNLFSQHRWAKGKELLDESLELYPDDANLHYLAGRYWWNGKNYDRARYHLVKACQINYHFVDAKTLLVNIEEITGNYSSAICYVNELLEINPYWKGLWLRKVDLYKKMGNFEEANTLLQRLSQIYPSDASITGDYFDVLESAYQQARLDGDMNAAEAALKEIVRITPSDTDYQMAYTNILVRAGRTGDALDNLAYAINASPGNEILIRKATDIMLAEGRTASALALVRAQYEERKTPELKALYDYVLSESARQVEESDPYAMYTRVYKTEHTYESLQYLLNHSVQKGYYDDALYYIDEARRVRGDAAKWYMMEYEVYDRMGRHESARKTLDAGLAKYPDDYDLNLAACRQRVNEGAELMAEGAYNQAIPVLEFVRKRSVDPEIKALAIRRLATCYKETGQMEQAVQMLRERLKTDPEYLVTVDYAAVLVKQGKPEAALQALEASYVEARDSAAVLALGNAYKETAYTYLRDRLANGAVKGLQDVTDMLLEIDNTDYWGLRYSLRTAEDPLPYALRGIRLYPDDLTFPIKAANELSERGQHERALNILRAYLSDFPADDDLQRVYAGVSGQIANKLYKDKDYTRAEAVLDSALAVRPMDPEIRYTRGLLYEKQHQWDSAYVFQSKYTPSVLEEGEYKARMNTLRARTLHNSVDAGIDLFRFTDNQHLLGLATIGYTRSWAQDALEARLNYTGRDADYDSEEKMYNSVGGQGLQLQASWTHDFENIVTMKATSALANAFFPRWVVDVDFAWHLPRDWDLETGVSYRFMRDGASMYSLNGGVFKTFGHFYAGGRATIGALHDIFFFNTLARFRFYPVEGGRTYIEAQGGAGTAPELTFLNYYYSSGIYDRLNSFVSLTAQWAVTYNLALSVSGTWNTVYDQRTAVTYRNMLMAHVSVAIYF